MELTAEQLQAVEQGDIVQVELNGIPCVILNQQAYKELDELDYDPPTTEEMDLLAAEAVDLLEGDGLDEPLES